MHSVAAFGYNSIQRPVIVVSTSIYCLHPTVLECFPDPPSLPCDRCGVAVRYVVRGCGVAVRYIARGCGVAVRYVARGCGVAVRYVARGCGIAGFCAFAVLA